MSGNEKKELPWWQKYTLTLNEASEYFGIGYKKLKLFVQEHSDEDFVLWNVHGQSDECDLVCRNL